MPVFEDYRLGHQVRDYLRTLPELRGVHLWLADATDLEGELEAQLAGATDLLVQVEGPGHLTVDYTGERLLEVTVRLRESLWHRPRRNAQGQLASALAARLAGWQPPGAPEALRPHPFTPRAVPEVEAPAAWREEVLRYALTLGYAV
ncbi:MAG: hypothetical protein E1N59_2275 [Puniceicoccaceae bacterium 5H]|nr:MAG: hypothetical protein E1N59_2275 [Puniceicoccaceae bacterium 5H]